MKKYFYLALTLFAALAISSCSDDAVESNSETPVTPTEDIAEYTICMYATGGDNLDFSIVYELLDNIDEIAATNGKVRFVGIYKPSPKHQKVLGDNGGTRYFDLTFNTNVSQEEIDKDAKALVAEFEKDPTKDSIVGLMSDKVLAKDIVGKQYADANFKVNDPDNIAKALKFLTEQAPAKKYILLTDDHGGGWKFTEDKPLSSASNAITRGMVYDNGVGISLDELNSGVERSGVKFDALFCDLCLMAHLENLYGYSINFPICIASAETTTGSKIGLLAKRLATLGGDATHDQIFSECSDWVTTINAASGYKKWETYKDLTYDDLMNGNSQFEDMGCYDLTKIGNLTSSLTDISKWFANAVNENTLKYVVEKSVLTTLYTTMPNATNLKQSLYRQDAIQVIKNNYNKEWTVDSIADAILSGKGTELYDLMANNGEANIKDFYDTQIIMNYGYPMAYFVWNTARIARQYNMTKEAEELDKLLNNYTDALKTMCKIQCSYYDFSGCIYDGVEYPAMDPYLWTSPTVVLASLNTAGYRYEQRIDYSPWAKDIKNVDEAIAVYKNTKFDQVTNWGQVLKGIDINPNVVTNVFRQIPVIYAKFGNQQ